MADVYVVGTTVTIEVEFKNKAGAKADVSGLKYQMFLNKFTPLNELTTLTPATCKVSTGEYEWDYTIPTTIDTDAHKAVVVVVTGIVEGVDKVQTYSIPINWKSEY